MITSAQNQYIKRVAALKTVKGRDESGLFIIEGERFVNELPQDWQASEFIIAEGYTGDLSRYEARARVRRVSDTLFKTLSDTVTPQGVLAVARKKEYGPELLHTLKRRLVLLCEDIRDPGNLGTLLRTADAVGFDCVILTKGSVDVYNPKTLRSAAGSVFHIPVIERAGLRLTIDRLHGLGVRVLAALPSGGTAAHETDLTAPVAIMLGNEAHGLSPEAISLADAAITVPMPGRAESLNASVAGAMLMYETARQRMNTQTTASPAAPHPPA